MFCLINESRSSGVGLKVGYWCEDCVWMIGYMDFWFLRYCICLILSFVCEIGSFICVHLSARVCDVVRDIFPKRRRYAES